MDSLEILNELIERSGTLEEQVAKAISIHFEWHADDTGVEEVAIGLRFDWLNDDNSDIFNLCGYTVYVAVDEFPLGTIEINHDSQTFTVSKMENDFINEMLIEAIEFEQSRIVRKQDNLTI